MSRGPLAVRWGAPPAPVLHAGTIAWGPSIMLASHWLDDRDNAIHWDGIRNVVPPLEPGARATVDVRVRALIPPGRYRLAFDMVAEHRAWFSELGSPMLSRDVDVGERPGEPHTALPPELEPAPDWAERVRAAHAEGYGVVAGAVDWPAGVLKRQARELAAYAPGPGRVPGFAAPLLCPSVLPGIVLEPLGAVHGLPSFAAPQGEPWVYDGRIVLRARR